MNVQTRSPTFRGSPDWTPDRRPRMLGVVVALISALIVLGAVAAFTVVRQRNEIRDRDANIVTLTANAQQDRAAVAALTARVGQLQDRLAKATGGTARLQGRLAAEKAELADIAGPALSDGRFMGRLVAVGADQQPPRVVIDLEQWFYGPAADQAALEDGALPPGSSTFRTISTSATRALDCAWSRWTRPAAWTS